MQLDPRLVAAGEPAAKHGQKGVLDAEQGGQVAPVEQPIAETGEEPFQEQGTAAHPARHIADRFASAQGDERTPIVEGEGRQGPVLQAMARVPARNRAS